jgi:hypothetical protein
MALANMKLQPYLDSTESDAEENICSQPTSIATTTEGSLKEERIRAWQHLLPHSLGKQQHARAVYIILSLYKSYTQVLVGTCPRMAARERAKVMLHRVHTYRDQGAGVPHAHDTCSCPAERHLRSAFQKRLQRRSGRKAETWIFPAKWDHGQAKGHLNALTCAP